MNHLKYSRGISTLLALALLAPSAVMAQEDGTIAQTGTQPVVENGTPTTPEPTNMDIRPIRIEMKRGENTQTTNRPIDDRMLRRASGTPPIPAAAQERLERREGMASGTLPMNGQVRERMEEAKARMAEARQEQMKEFVRKTIARMRAAVERLSKLADRIDSRMEKIEAAQNTAKNASSTSPSGGVGKATFSDLSLCLRCTGRARAALDEAKAALTEAETLFASYVPPAPVEVENATGTPKRPQPGMGQPSPVRDALKEADAAIRVAHKAILEAVASMRALPTVNKATEETSNQ